MTLCGIKTKFPADFCEVVMKRRLVIAIGVASLLVACTVQTEQTPTSIRAYNNISVVDLKTQLDAGEKPLLLDVRTEREFTGALGHLGAAVLIPVQELEARIGELKSHKAGTIMVYCRSGNRSKTAADILAKHGFRATNVVGGMKAWNTMMTADNKKK